jgi:hypothetical protein
VIDLHPRWTQAENAGPVKNAFSESRQQYFAQNPTELRLSSEEFASEPVACAAVGRLPCLWKGMIMSEESGVVDSPH